MNTKPIILIDDDEEDLALFQEVLKELKVPNEIIVFSDGYLFLEFIRATANRAFFILCDINMSKVNGIQLKKLIQEDEKLQLKCVPFIFMSSSGASTEVMKAYSHCVQGYFVKPSTFYDMKNLLQFIVTYWSHSQIPGT